MTSAMVLYGPRGEELSTPKTRQIAAVQSHVGRIRAKFDAAQTTTENARYWSNADYLGPNAELNATIRRTLRSRARYECANNGYAAGLIRTLAHDTIGTGPSVVVTDPRINRDDGTVVENLFWDWCLSVEMPEKLRKMRYAKARDGESFAQLFTNTQSKTEVQLDFSPFEADYVASIALETSLSNLLDGLIIDDYGNVIAYNILDEHPGEAMDYALFGRSSRVPAQFIIHMFHSDRPGQYRGCPEILSSLPLYAQLRRYTLAVLRASESAAIPSWLLETQQPPSEMAFGDPFETLETERGMGVTLPAGYKMSQLKAEHPTSTYPQFKREIVSEAARGTGVPYNKAAGDSSSYNYSSGRLDHQTYYKALRVERSSWETRACSPLFREWWTEARRIGGFLPETTRNFFPRHEWRWDGDEHVDPTKEADAAVTRIANGLTAYADEVAKLGGDASVIQRKNAESFGLSIEDYRKRQADKFFGAQIASSSQDTPEQPASNPFGGNNNA